jgi:perosamine synthetase
MMRKFPIIRPSVGVNDIWRAVLPIWETCVDDFPLALANETNKKYVFLTNSGISALYLALAILRRGSERREVVLPAYTAGSLVVAIRKAGLKPVLCDIRLDDFNAGAESLLSAISGETLAVMAVHMFGIPLSDIPALKAKIPQGVCFIEDCCQAQGSKVDNLEVGNFGEISFFSFNRGKNFSLFAGGCVATNNEAWAEKIGLMIRQTERISGLEEFFLGSKMWLSVLATNPCVYGWANRFISRFKENTVRDDFTVGQLSGLKAALAMILMPKKAKCFSRRNENGEYLRNGLKSVPGLRLADIKAESYPVYNRFPVLFDDIAVLERKQRKLWSAGFESSRMYLNPLHKMFRLGYLPQDFPNANYLAEHVLTLPVYPALKEKHLSRMIKILRS